MCIYIYNSTLSPIVAVFQWSTEVGLLPDLHGHGHEGEIVGDGILDLLWHRSIGRQDVPCKFPGLVWSWWVHVASQSCTATKHCSQKTRGSAPNPNIAGSCRRSSPNGNYSFWMFLIHYHLNDTGSPYVFGVQALSCRTLTVHQTDDFSCQAVGAFAKSNNVQIKR